MTALIDAAPPRPDRSRRRAPSSTHADELTALDQAIGDGDHGANMKRGFEAVLADVDALARQAAAGCAEGDRHAAGHEGRRRLRPALRHAVPGARQGACRTRPTGRLSPRRSTQAIAAVKARGKSDVGQKTMLDVLAPVQRGARRRRRPRRRSPRARIAAAEATIPMKATRGRASFLGDRSIGHMDPGARSSALIVGAIAECSERRA